MVQTHFRTRDKRRQATVLFADISGFADIYPEKATSQWIAGNIPWELEQVNKLIAESPKAGVKLI